eukprot:8576697-Lingulodinium_polyedra.AAC.1
MTGESGCFALGAPCRALPLPFLMSTASSKRSFILRATAHALVVSFLSNAMKAWMSHSEAPQAFRR